MENNTKFVVGEVVELNSGGKPMTIVGIDGENISCQWFKKSGDLDGGIFKATALRKANPEKGGEDDAIDLLSNFLRT